MRESRAPAPGHTPGRHPPEPGDAPAAPPGGLGWQGSGAGTLGRPAAPAPGRRPATSAPLTGGTGSPQRPQGGGGLGGTPAGRPPRDAELDTLQRPDPGAGAYDFDENFDFSGSSGNKQAASGPVRSRLDALAPSAGKPTSPLVSRALDILASRGATAAAAGGPPPPLQLHTPASAPVDEDGGSVSPPPKRLRIGSSIRLGGLRQLSFSGAASPQGQHGTRPATLLTYATRGLRPQASPLSSAADAPAGTRPGGGSRKAARGGSLTLGAPPLHPSQGIKLGSGAARPIGHSSAGAAAAAAAAGQGRSSRGSSSSSSSVAPAGGSGSGGDSTLSAPEQAGGSSGINTRTRWHDEGWLVVDSIEAAQAELERLKPGKLGAIQLENHMSLGAGPLSHLNGTPVALACLAFERQRVLYSTLGRPLAHSQDLEAAAADPVCGEIVRHVWASVADAAVEAAAPLAPEQELGVMSMQMIQNQPGVSGPHQDTGDSTASSDGGSVADSDGCIRVVVRVSVCQPPADGSHVDLGKFALTFSQRGAGGGVTLDLTLSGAVAATKFILGKGSPLFHLAAVLSDRQLSFIVEVWRVDMLPRKLPFIWSLVQEFRRKRPGLPPLPSAAVLEELLPGGSAALQLKPVGPSPRLHNTSAAGTASMARDGKTPDGNSVRATSMSKTAWAGNREGKLRDAAKGGANGRAVANSKPRTAEWGQRATASMVVSKQVVSQVLAGTGGAVAAGGDAAGVADSSAAAGAGSSGMGGAVAAGGGAAEQQVATARADLVHLVLATGNCRYFGTGTFSCSNSTQTADHVGRLRGLLQRAEPAAWCELELIARHLVCRGGPYAALLTEAGVEGARQAAEGWLAEAAGDTAAETEIRAAWKAYAAQRRKAASAAVKEAKKRAKRQQQR